MFEYEVNNSTDGTWIWKRVEGHPSRNIWRFGNIVDYVTHLSVTVEKGHDKRWEVCPGGEGRI